MRYASIICAALTLSAAATAHAGPTFSATLSGANERPTPVATPATGSAVAELLGGPGTYVLDYSVSFSGLTSPATPIAGSPGHIHRSVNPPGNPPTDQVGPIVFPLADIAAGVTSAMVDGEWRYDDATNPLTDALVASLMAGELYVNIHSVDHPAGEVRGQLVANAAAVPLPAALPLGVAGMALAGVVARRYRATVR